MRKKLWHPLYPSFKAAVRAAKRRAHYEDRPYFIFRDGDHWRISTRQPEGGEYWKQEGWDAAVHCENLNLAEGKLQ